MDQLKHFKAQAIIFDKDGTLINFDAMWGSWTVFLAEQLHKASGLEVQSSLCLMMGFDENTKKVLAHGKLATSPMAQLYRFTVEVMQSLGLSTEAAEHIVEKCWCIPDPVLLAKPFTDMRELFRKLQNENIKIAIATADDRAPTQAMIEAFDIEEYISSMVCGDDGVIVKPAPDMVLEICRQINIDPSKTIVIGDTVADLKMARAAGAGLVVGVLSGVSSTKDLAPFADVLIESVDELHSYSIQKQTNETDNILKGLNPDIVF
ncbi:MAG: HAD family hydrolase [Anaerolineales bacterium]|nr:HAD family hydrolase [Anaerolineales bacterium]